MGILHKSQGRLEAFQLSHCIWLSHKLLDQSQEFAPLWTPLIVDPLEQAESLLITTKTGFPHLARGNIDEERRDNEWSFYHFNT